MASEEERKRQIREAYNDTQAKKRPKTRIYVAILIVTVLLGILYFMLYTPQGTSLLQQAGITVNVPANAAEASAVTNDLGTNLDETTSIIDDLSASLGV